MKKKLLMSISAAALAAVMCVGFVACGEDGNPAAKIEGEELPAETFAADWEAAFAKENFEDFKMVLKENSEYVQDGKTQKATTSLTMVRAEGVESIKITGKSAGQSRSMEYCNDFANSVYYKKTPETNNKWLETQVCDLTVDEQLGMLLMFEDMAEDFTYSATEKGYVYVEGGTKIVLKFQEGKIVAMCNEVTISESAGGGAEPTVVRHDVYDVVLTYGGQKVTPPTIKGSSDSNAPEGFAGTWEFFMMKDEEHETHLGDVIEVGDIDDTVPLTPDFHNLILEANGSFTMKLFGATAYSGKWTETEDGIQLTVPSEEEEEEMYASMNGDKLILNTAPDFEIWFTRKN